MTDMADQTPPDTGSGRLLLIGDISRVLLDPDSVGRCLCEVRTNILDGIDVAARTEFDVIGIVLDATSSQLCPALRALRKCTKARIVLLTRMYEEPIARRLVADVPGEERLADAYLICPTRLANLFAPAGAPGEETTPEPVGASEQASSPDVEKRMRYLERLATTDDLTGLKNRRYLWEFARQILERARETNGRVTLLVFDIDNFKHYNDVYGHPAGDEILRQAAILMRRCCRSHDVVGRIGGDEFAAVFWDDPGRAAGRQRDRRSPESEHPTEAISVANRFRSELGHTDLHLLGPGGEGVLTISGGLASFPRDGSTAEQLFERADHALLEAKRSGKNRIYLVGEPKNDIAEIE